MFKDFLEFIFRSNIISQLFIINFGFLFIKKKKIDLKKHSIISKKDIIKFKPKCLFYLKGYSSGTTNKPLTVYRSIRSIIAEEYFTSKFQYSKTKIISPKIAVIRGELIVDSNVTKPPFWKIKPFSRKLVMSCHHLSEQNIPYYFSELEKFKPDIIQAYPNSIYLLAKTALQIKWRPNWELKAVFTSSEKFTKKNFLIVKKVFKNVFDIYGQAERVARFHLCENLKYHILDNYSYVEFKKENKNYKIIGSNFSNAAMPLYRYDTGDYVSKLPKKNCKCGLKSRFVDDIIGRNDDFIKLSDGRILTRIDGLFKNFNEILEAQIIQDKINSIKIFYVGNSEIKSNLIENKIKFKFREILDKKIKIEIKRLKKIPRNKSGKFQSVISLI